MDRKLEILMAVIDEYIETGEPVGSKAIAEKFGNRISSATIRNTCAVLCEIGLLAQPHVSAGRVPTVRGYRVYIDILAAQRNLPPGDMDRVDALVADIFDGGDSVRNTARALSELTGYATMSAAVPQSDEIMCVQIISHGARLYNILIATCGGSVRTSLVRTEAALDAKDIEVFLNAANDLLSGLPTARVTTAVVQGLAVRLGSGLIKFSPLLAGLSETVLKFYAGELEVWGEGKLLQRPDFGQGDMKNLMQILTDRPLLAQLLDYAGDDIAVTLGPEIPMMLSDESAVLTSKYRIKNNLVGKLGVIAPIRIHYRSILPQIEYFKSRIENMLSAMAEDSNNQQEDGNEDGRKQG